MTRRPFASFVASAIWLVLAALWLVWTVAVAAVWLLFALAGRRRDARRVARAFAGVPRWGRVFDLMPGRRRQPYRPVVAAPGRRRLDMSAREREALVLVLRRRDGDCCRSCGDPIDFDVDQSDPWAEEVDHVVPFSLGGDCHVDNFQLLHAACNRRKGNRLDLRRVA